MQQFNWPLLRKLESTVAPGRAPFNFKVCCRWEVGATARALAVRRGDQRVCCFACLFPLSLWSGRVSVSDCLWSVSHRRCCCGGLGASMVSQVLRSSERACCCRLPPVALRISSTTRSRAFRFLASLIKRFAPFLSKTLQTSWWPCACVLWS